MPPSSQHCPLIKLPTWTRIFYDGWEQASDVDVLRRWAEFPWDAADLPGWTRRVQAVFKVWHRPALLQAMLGRGWSMTWAGSVQQWSQVCELNRREHAAMLQDRWGRVPRTLMEEAFRRAPPAAIRMMIEHSGRVPTHWAQRLVARIVHESLRVESSAWDPADSSQHNWAALVDRCQQMAPIDENEWAEALSQPLREQRPWRVVDAMLTWGRQVPRPLKLGGTLLREAVRFGRLDAIDGLLRQGATWPSDEASHPWVFWFKAWAPVWSNKTSNPVPSANQDAQFLAVAHRLCVAGWTPDQVPDLAAAGIKLKVWRDQWDRLTRRLDRTPEQWWGLIERHDAEGVAAWLAEDRTVLNWVIKTDLHAKAKKNRAHFQASGRLAQEALRWEREDHAEALAATLNTLTVVMRHERPLNAWIGAFWSVVSQSVRVAQAMMEDLPIMTQHAVLANAFKRRLDPETCQRVLDLIPESGDPLAWVDSDREKPVFEWALTQNLPLQTLALLQRAETILVDSNDPSLDVLDQARAIVAAKIQRQMGRPASAHAYASQIEVEAWQTVVVAIDRLWLHRTTLDRAERSPEAPAKIERRTRL